MKVVILTTSADKMGDHPTGAWSEEITGPYYAFVDAGADVAIASVSGGPVPIDAGSLSDAFKTENDKRFESSGDISKLETSVPLSSVEVGELDILFLAGGHGTCADFADGAVPKLVTDAYAAGKVVGAVCHGPTGLVNAKDGDKPLVAGKKIAAFSDVEVGAGGPSAAAHSTPEASSAPLPQEGQVQLTEKVPFLLEAKMKELGAEYVPSEPWSENAIADGKLVTGQNPQSSVKCAKLCLEAAK